MQRSDASFRFYEELNDFVPRERRKREIGLSFYSPAPVRHLIETLGVPHTEVELIIANGKSVGLEYEVGDGDRISVYPMFEALDVTPLLRLRERPLRNPSFLVDAHLGKLAHYLRMLGFDTLFGIDWSDRELAACSASQHRILLTRDRALLMHRPVTHGCYIRDRVPRQQLRYLVRRLDLYRLIHPFTRCMECNGALYPVAKSRICARLPAETRRRFDAFWTCRNCQRIYWRGSHYAHMCALIENLNLERAVGRACRV